MSNDEPNRVDEQVGAVQASFPELDLHDVVAFVRVVDAGSFSAAARATHVTKSSVSRRVARLEKRLDTQLLQRTTRSLTLTETGEVFYDRVAAALQELDAAAGLAAETRHALRGRIRLAAPQDVGAEVLPAIISSFLELHDEVSVELDLTSDDPDVVVGRYDLVLRIGHADTASHVTHIQDTRFGVYASAEYLERCEPIESVGDCADHDCVIVRGIDVWNMRNDRRSASVTVNGRLRTNDLTFARRAAIAGVGPVLLPELVGRIEVDRNSLVRVLPDRWADGVPLWLETPRTRHTPRRVEALGRHIQQHFPQ